MLSIEQRKEKKSNELIKERKREKVYDSENDHAIAWIGNRRSLR